MTNIKGWGWKDGTYQELGGSMMDPKTDKKVEPMSYIELAEKYLALEQKLTRRNDAANNWSRMYEEQKAEKVALEQRVEGLEKTLKATSQAESASRHILMFVRTDQEPHQEHWEDYDDTIAALAAAQKEALAEDEA